MSALYDFLQKNRKANALPLVHTTEAYFLKKIIRTGKIEATPCSVFKGENLAYFFIGRPAYKKDVSGEAEYWELPVCFIFEYFNDSVKRIFPFDSGAFASKDRYPNFISIMDKDEFDVGADNEAPEKLIGTFFKSPSNYYRLKPVSEERFRSDFDVDVLNEEIHALHKLIRSKSDRYDDRRFSIEMQFSDPVEFSSKKLLAVVLPEEYIVNKPLMDMLEGQLEATVISYPIYPTNVLMYYYAIYEKVELFYKQKGLL